MRRSPPHAAPFDAVCHTAYGYLAVRLDAGSVTELSLHRVPPQVRPRPLAAARQTLLDVQDYLHTGQAVRLPSLQLRGTPFQRRVWQALRDIPRGQTRTYGALARELQTGARAIGAACRANPALILVPCHRVVASVGAGGFAGRATGFWPDVKRRWLAAEGVHLP